MNPQISLVIQDLLDENSIILIEGAKTNAKSLIILKIVFCSYFLKIY